MAHLADRDLREGSFLLTLLHYAGWRLHVERGQTVVIRAARDGVRLHASGETLSRATAKAFAAAMRGGAVAATAERS